MILIRWTFCLLKSEKNYIYSDLCISSCLSQRSLTCMQDKGSLILPITILALPLVFTHAAGSKCASSSDVFTHVGVSPLSFNSAKCGRSTSPVIGACDEWSLLHWSHVQDKTWCFRGSETTGRKRPNQSIFVATHASPRCKKPEYSKC